MPEAFSFFSAAKALTTPVVALWQLIVNRSQLSILLPRGQDVKAKDAHVLNQGNNTGLFYFGITSASAQDVEVSEIVVSSDSPLHLQDPQSGATTPFFNQSQSTDSTFPFSLKCTESFIVKEGLIVPFGIKAHFGNGIQASEIQVSLKGKRVAKSFGFLFPGRETFKSQKTVLRLSTTPPQGLLIPQGHLSAPIQPFMRTTQSAVIGSAVRVNTRDSAGHPNSRIV